MLNADGLKIIFWVAVGVASYVYLGYPLLLSMLARCRSRKPVGNCGTLPRITLLISAFNEQSVIAEKIENSLSLDYPGDLLEILIVSDCSSDGTDEIVRKYGSRGAHLIRQAERCGKSAGLNLGAAQASGEILVFSDANAMYQPDAIRRLVSHFSDLQVGYVVGNARYVEKAGAA